MKGVGAFQTARESSTIAANSPIASTRDRRADRGYNVISNTQCPAAEFPRVNVYNRFGVTYCQTAITGTQIMGRKLHCRRSRKNPVCIAKGVAPFGTRCPRSVRDVMNVYRADEVHRKGFSYTGIGRPAAAEANAGDPQLAGFEVSF